MYDLPSTTSRKYPYADDLALLHTSRDWNDLEEALSQDMATLSAYLKTWLKLSNAKTVTAAFHLHDRGAQRELKVYNNGKLLPFCSVPIYLGVKLDRLLTFRHHFKILSKKLATRVTLLGRLAGLGWGAGAKILRTAALSLVYATAQYCAPVWCRGAHILLIDSVLNDALRIVTGCLRPTPTHHHPILSGVQPAELRRLRATLSSARRGTLDPDQILHCQLAGLPDFPLERLKSRRPSVSTAWKLLNDLSKLGIGAAQWTKYRWSPEYSKRTSVLHVFIPRTSSGPLGVGLPRTSWVERNRLRTGIGCFYSSMNKWGSRSLAELQVWWHQSKPQITLSPRAPYIGHL